MIESPPNLDQMFSALADPTRSADGRAAERRGPASVKRACRACRASLLAAGAAPAGARAERVGAHRKDRPHLYLHHRHGAAEPRRANGSTTAASAGKSASIGLSGALLDAEDEKEERTMKPRSVTHASFTLERHFRQSPSRVFAAFATEKEQAGLVSTAPTTGTATSTRWISASAVWKPASAARPAAGSRAPLHLPGHRSRSTDRLLLRHGPQRRPHLGVADHHRDETGGKRDAFRQRN